jgi:hypothetical protein
MLTNRLEVLGSRYQPPGRNERALDLASGVAIREGGGLPEPATNGIALDRSNRFAVEPPNPDQLELSLKTSTGLFEGRIRSPVTGRAVVVKGVVLQKPGVGGGFFLGPNETGSFYLGPAGRFPLFPMEQP